MLKNNGVYVGAWRDKNGKIRYLRHAGPEHVLCYAPTRSGKGVGLILPTLLSWQQSVFVTDLKGELYELTSGWRQKYAHNRILRFEPAAAAGSRCFNPMAELRLGTEHEVGDVQNLALLIVDPDGRGRRLWLLSLVYFCQIMGLYAVSFWVSSIIKASVFRM